MELQYPRTVEITHCFLCGSDSSKHILFEIHRAQSGEDRYLICKNCGLVFQSPRLSQENLDAFYASQYRSLVQGSEEPIEKDLRIQRARAQHIVLFCKEKIPNISRCLDIGSSTGILLKKMKETFGCEVIGIEPGDAYRQYSQRHGIPAVESLEALGKEWKGSFDLITMAHTFEHLPDPITILNDLREHWLSPKGFLLVEVPNLYGHQAMELAHLTAFSPTSLKSLMQKAGFRILKVRSHGKPRSRLIPLYLTAIAMAGDGAEESALLRSNSHWVKLRRKVAMFWNKLASKYATRWAWLPWPDVE